MNIAEIRQKYPQYDNLSDEILADKLHKKFYPNMDFADFSQKIGLVKQVETPVVQQPNIQPMTDEQKAQAQEMANQIRPKKTLGDKISEFMVTNPVSRQIGFGLQGVANAGLNPAGYVARAMGVDTKPLEAQNMAERVTELAGQYGYDAAAMVPILGLASASAPAVAPYIAPLVEGGIPLALTGSTGSAIATGIINPENPYVRMVTDVLGGGIATGLATPKFTAPKQDVKSITNLEKSVGKDVLAQDIAEAQRTGRSLLEVGGDEITQRATQAKLQTPEARKILLDAIEKSSAEQPARTKTVINEALGTEGKNATLSQVMENAKAEAQPIYKELEDIGDLAAYEIKDIPEQNFKRWFESSKVVDENGQPLKLYHGTDADFDAFDMSKGRSTMDIQGAFFSPYDIDAKGYGQNLKEVYLNIKNPADEATAYKVLRKYQGQNDAGLKAKQDLQRQGFDGVFNGYDEYIAFEPNQIKSVNNSGAWSSSSSLTDAGWKPESQLAKAIKNNDVLADTISRVKRANSSLKNLPDTDFRVVNEARKALSQASMNKTELSGYEARQALNELDPILNNITGGKLAQANKLYSDAYQFEKASDLGRDVFNSRISPDDLKMKIGGLTANERKAAKIGLREEIMNKIGSTNNQTNVLNKFLPENVREKINIIAGENQGAKIIDEAEQAVRLRNNLNKVFSGSQTAEKGILAKLFDFKSHPVLSSARAVVKPYNRNINIRTAEALTDKNIADKYYRVMNARRLNAQPKPKGYTQSGLRSLFERLTEEKE